MTDSPWPDDPRPDEPTPTAELGTTELRTQVLVGGETVRLGPADPPHVGDIRLHGRFEGGNRSTLKYCGRSPSGYHFVKVLDDESLRSDFDNEVGIAAMLTDVANLPRFTGSGTVVVRGRPRPYYAQLLLEGPLLLTQLHPRGLDPGRLLQLATDLANAIDGLARRGIAHGDIKPEHIIDQGNTDQGHYVLVDLGSGRSSDPAKQPSGLRNTGTPGYLAPERQAGGPPTVPADVFSWGLVVLYAATGQHPLRGGAPDLAADQLGARLARLPAPLRELVKAALRTNPHERPSAAALARATAALRPSQTAVLTNDLAEPSAGSGVVLSRHMEPVVKALAGLGNLHVAAYRAILIAVALITGWITYALVVGG
ncbi:MAG: protein kinase [Propionibacteriaceae bacterium]|nr:protein kinase [Propionibacteriaceae bacterium]